MGEQEKKRIEFNSKAEFVKYLEAKADNHRNYKFYGSKKAIMNMCETHSVYLSDGNNWNDEEDKKNMQNDEVYHHFAICFSFSISENVAMWMLYSKDNGCIIDFDKNVIQEIKNKSIVEIGFFKEDGSFDSIQTLSVKENDIRFQLFDIVYFGEPENIDLVGKKYYFKRSNDVEKEFDKMFLDCCKFYRKRLPWFYENECRLVVSIRRDLIDHDIPGLRLKISIDESNISRLRNVKRIINSPNAKNVLIDGFYSKNTESKLAGRINWNLKDQFCDGCEYKKIEGKN